MKKITKKNADDHLDDLIDIAESIEANKITILTGSNGTGKSFVRKLLVHKIPNKNQEIKVASISMERRAGLNMDGAMGAFTKDADWTPTSMETYKLIRGLISTSKEGRYIIIDEPEIGMGEELVLGLAKFLNENLKKVSYGVLVITHSRVLVQNLRHDVFINIDGLTYVEWVTRKIVASDLDEISEQSNILFRAIQERVKSKMKENESN